MPRFTRYGLCFASLTALTLLAVSARKPVVGPASATRPIHDWDIPELAIHLNRKGVEVRLRAVPKNGLLDHSAYLTSTTKEWEDLNILCKDRSFMDQWCGTLYCERIGDKDASHLIEQWGDEYCLLVGPFILYGDTELLKRVRDALAEYLPAHAR